VRQPKHTVAEELAQHGQSVLSIADGQQHRLDGLHGGLRRLDARLPLEDQVRPCGLSTNVVVVVVLWLVGITVRPSTHTAALRISQNDQAPICHGRRAVARSCGLGRSGYSVTRCTGTGLRWSVTCTCNDDTPGRESCFPLATLQPRIDAATHPGRSSPLLQQRHVGTDQGVHLEVSIRKGEADIDDPLGVLVAVRKEAEAVEDAYPPVRRRFLRVGGHNHAAHRAVERRTVGRQVDVQLEHRLVRRVQRLGKEAQLLGIGDTQVLEKLLVHEAVGSAQTSRRIRRLRVIWRFSSTVVSSTVVSRDRSRSRICRRARCHIRQRS